MTEYKHIHVDCPDCRDHFLAPVNVEELMAGIKPREVVKEITKFPSFMPGAPCQSGNCSLGGYHKNPAYKDKLNKRCANCETLNGTSAKRCFACKGTEFYDDLLSDDELRDLGIDIPQQSMMMGMGHHLHHHHGESGGEGDNVE
jgi:hypothetical protein